ncbi:hypothetical protein HY003_01175 [Candidatus Saccharibacteria bacterium]|nr:hypothetical protein [Candidatus Saccharibacteria bacterium]MBI3337889.1 hypothetical protein [Candidatus Saccharibacteria bacterium]
MLKRLCLFAVLTIVVSASSIVVLGSKAGAVTATGWKAGRIIDDMVFTNKNAMSLNEVQDFLNQKVGTNRGNSYSVPGVCDTNGTKTSELGGGIRAQYGASRGNPAPFTCLKDYWEVPKTDPAPGVPASNYGGVAIPTGAKSAAQLIWEAGQRYNISPKVLLIMIQKESAGPLITDDWPFRSQYTYAMGAHCPDSGPGGSANCDQNYAGFSMQINESARLLRYYLDNMSQPWWSYKKPGINNILWNVEPTGCGGANVNIENKSTAALYTYTPYQPNQAALNNMYGTGDGCSAYGNRNFWRMYNDWFGPTLGSPPNINWNFETLDGTAQSISTVIGSTGNYPYTLTVGGWLHVFYYDVAGGNLRHAWIDPAGWHFETIDGAGGANGQIDADVGGMSKAIVYNNQLYVMYHDFQNNSLRIASLSGGIWTAQTLDGTGGTNGRLSGNMGLDITAITNGDSLHLFYSDATQGNLRHAWHDGSIWRFENLDGTPASIASKDGNIGQGIKAEFIGNSIHAFYYDGTAGNLRHAWTDANGWHFEDLDGSGSSVSRYNSTLGSSPEFAIWQGSLHVYYHDIAYGTLRHAWTDANGWHFEDLDGSGSSVSRYISNVGLRSSIVIAGSTMNIFYDDAPTRSIRQAWFDAYGWHFINIDGESNAVSGTAGQFGEYLSATLFMQDVQVFYFNASDSSLKHAWGPLR